MTSSLRAARIAPSRGVDIEVRQLLTFTATGLVQVVRARSDARLLPECGEPRFRSMPGQGFRLETAVADVYGDLRLAPVLRRLLRHSGRLTGSAAGSISL